MNRLEMSTSFQKMVAPGRLDTANDAFSMSAVKNSFSEKAYKVDHVGFSKSRVTSSRQSKPGLSFKPCFDSFDEN